MKHLVLLTLLLTSLMARSQEPELLQRLNGFITANQNLDVDKILDFTHPKAFTILSREQMKKSLQATFHDDEEMKITIDSMQVDSLYPVFSLGDGRYARITYSMLMFLEIKTAEHETQEDIDEMNDMLLDIYKGQYGEENVSLNEEQRVFRIHVHQAMAAINDPVAKEWCFVDIENAFGLTTILLNKDVLEKLDSYK